jgi:RNA polymerase sigma factor (sigma-70 family)
MSWAGGFGESLDVGEVVFFDEHVTVDELLPRFRKWLYAVAYGIGADPLCIDDIVQEGYIAMWRALKTHDARKGVVTTWITNAARMRMMAMMQRGRPFGHEARRGVVALEDRVTPDSLERLMEDGGIEVAVLSHRVLDDIVSAYHHGDIVRAVNDLPSLQRRYIVLRFWAGMDTGAIAHSLDVPLRTAGYLWTGAGAEPGTRARLAAALAPLAS